MKNKASVFFAILILTFSCKPKTDSLLLDAQKDQAMLSEYFMAATVGVISASEPFRYVFNVPLTSVPSKEILDKLISIDPKVEGEVSLSNNTILTFTPKESLRSNQIYKVLINLPLLDEKRFDKNLVYLVKTYQQDMKVEREGLIINDDASVSMILGVKTADKVDVSNLKSCFDSDADEIVVLQRSVYDYQIDVRFKSGIKPKSYIKFSGEKINCDAKGEVAIFDVNTNDFEIIYTYQNVDNKEFNIYFSQRIHKAMDLTGLIKVNDQNASYTVKNNVLTIFLSELRNEEKHLVSLDKNVKSVEGKILKNNFSFDIQMQQEIPTAMFLSDGNYFPSEGDFKIPIKTRALDAVRVVVVEIKQENVLHYLAWQSIAYADFYSIRMYGKPVYDEVVSLKEGLADKEGWKIYGIDLSSRIKKSPGSIYHISLDFGAENTSLSCKASLKKFKVNSRIPDKDFFSVKDEYYDDYYYYGEDYKWEENNDPCKLAFYVNKEPVQKLFICSDFSVIAKKAGKDYYIALSKLIDLSSVSGADVSLYDLQAEKISTSKTSSDGFATFLNVRSDASVIKIEKNSQVTYLSLDANQSNSLTEFDISGERSDVETEFYTYADRDVWRPGDSIYVDLMINKSQSSLPKGIPIVMTFYNTENMVIDEQIQSIDSDQKLIYSFTLHTPKAAKTGLYRCMMQVGPKRVKKNIRIETIKPNSTEVKYVFDKMVDNTIFSATISGSLKVNYLTGFEVKNGRVKAFAKGRKVSVPFSGYKDYYFDVYDQSPLDNNFNLFELNTDEKGFGRVPKSQSLQTFNGPVSVSIETEIGLPGGGLDKEGRTVILSPFETYIGAKRKEGSGWNGNHTFDENVEVNLVNITDHGQLNSKANNISYTLQKHINSWWVDKYRLHSAGNFVNAEFWQDVKSAELSMTGKSKIIYQKNTLEKGAYKLTIRDESSGHASQVFFTVYDGIESIPGAQPYIIEFQTDKEAYKAGEKVKLMLPDVEGAKALVSIEKGNKVIDQKWFLLGKSNNVFTMTTDKTWAPNIYIHVTLMQKYSQENNDLPVRMYGVKHIKMDGVESPLKPVSDISDKLESNKTYTFTVSESEGRNMEYTLALVDEGLLNLTGFSSPDPFTHFNGKYPLLVKTWDIYQYLINYFKGKFAGIISIGGDDAYNPDAIVEVNRFKPISIHQGPYKLGRSGKNKHTITIPNYIGKLRMVIVACNESNFGKTEKYIPVKNPLMVQSQFPRTLNVSDKLQLPITILRDDSKINNATITAIADASLVKGFTPSKSLTFGGQEQISHIYNVEVLNKTGKLNVELGIEGGGKSMKEQTEIAINFPNSYESENFKNIVPIGGKLEILSQVKGFRNAFSSKLMISGLKLPNFAKYATELIEYPYGCLEQTTSSGFGQLYLDKILELDPKESRERLENLQTTIQKLMRLQQASGKFNYWDNQYYHAWSDIYTGNFMVEMQRLGYLPRNSDMLSKWLDAHGQSANNWALAESTSDYTYESESLAQAYRLFVLAKAGKPSKSAMNRFVTSNLSKNALTWWLIAGSFQLSGYNSKANEFMAKAENIQKESNTTIDYASFGDSGRDLALIVEILSYFENDKKRSDEYYDKMVETLNESGWVSTQTKGYAFIAAFKYFGSALQMTDKVNYTLSGSSGTKSYQHSSYEPKIINLEKVSFNETISIQNKGKGKLYVYQTNRFIDTDLIKSASSSNLGMNVIYYNATRNISGLSGLKMGDDIIIDIKVTNPSALEQNNLALNLKMPSGWELINPRIYNTNSSEDKTKYNYQDFRDDRVYTFFGLKAGQSTHFSFKAKAAFTGDFFMSAVTCENMYKGNVYAKSESKRVIVSK